jgi:Ca-activated chloride channel family protein
MNVGLQTRSTGARFRTSLAVATLAAAVSLISASAQSPSRPAAPPSEAASAGQVPGQPAAPSSPQQPDSAPSRQSPSFKAGVDLVSLNVTVADSAARYVTDLQQQDFQVFEDGVMQDVTFFNKTNLPIALGLLLDTSASMETRLPIAQEAAIGFSKRLRPQDLAEVIEFDSRVLILQTFTNKASELEQAIRKTSAGGSTSMYNAIYIALKDLKKVVATNVDEIRRQAIVVLSDGEDTSSLLPFEEVLDLAKRSETAIYAIGLRSNEVGNSSNKGFKEAEFVLRQLSHETGGRAFFPTQASELTGIYGQISDELSSQYTVGYSSHNTKRDGAWRRVVIRVNRQNAVTRTKQGYFAPAH